MTAPPGSNWATEATDVAFLDKAILDLGGENVFELIHPHHGEVLVERIRTATTRRLTVVGKQKSCLVNAINVGRFGDKIRDFRTGLSCYRNAGVEQASLVKQTLRS